MSSNTFSATPQTDDLWAAESMLSLGVEKRLRHSTDGVNGAHSLGGNPSRTNEVNSSIIVSLMATSAAETGIEPVLLEYL